MESWQLWGAASALLVQLIAIFALLVRLGRVLQRQDDLVTSVDRIERDHVRKDVYISDQSALERRVEKIERKTDGG